MNIRIFVLSLLFAGLSLHFGWAQPVTRALESASNARMPFLPQMIAGSNDPEETLDAYFNGLGEGEIATPQNWELIRSYAFTREGTSVQALLEHRPEFNALAGIAAVDSHLYRIFSRETENEDPTNDKNMMALKAEMQQLRFAGWDILCDRLEVIRLKEAEEFDALTQLVSQKYFTANAMRAEVADMLFRTAENFACSRTPERLAFAAQCAAKSAEILPAYPAMMEYALILFRQKQNEQALAASEAAIAFGKKQGIDTQTLEALVSEVKAAATPGAVVGYHIEDGYVEFIFTPESYQFAQDEYRGNVVAMQSLRVERVSVVGDFNDWETSAWELVQDGSRFVLRKELAAFTKKKTWGFRFVVNGQYHIAPPVSAANKRIRYESCNLLQDMTLQLTVQ